ncbi:MAG: Heparinase family protein [Phycisphaerales bacterium]|nr:Heparinase family protein [Phycisphaerales bacterium]
MAYRLTNDPKYINELMSQLTSWSAQNPNLANPNDWPNVSPHWWLLDAADRADNWTWSYFMVLGTAGWTPQANTLFLSRIYDHGDFLARATPGSLKANRTTLQATGLLTIAQLFPQFADAPAWQRQATSLMFDCLNAQFYADGGHIEETPAYQSATLSALAQNYQLSELNGETMWSRKPRRKLTRAIEAYYQLLSPDGTPPGLSDTYRASTALPFLTNASFIFDDDRYRLTTPRLDDVLLIGPDRLQQAAVSVHTYLPDRGTSYALPDAGYYLLRSRELGGPDDAGSATQVVFDAGPKGGTHGHYDLLSFELADSTLHTLIADPGPYRYDDSADRRWVVSTPAHNTISIDGLNHAAIEGTHNPAIVVDRFESAPDHALITAHHYAYEYLKGSPVVGRTIWLDRSGDNRTPLVLVADYGQASATHTFTTSFTLPGKEAKSLGNGIIEDKLTHFYTLRLQSIPVTGQTSSLRPTFISSRPPPSEKDPARRFAVSQTGHQAIFVTLISEYITTGEFAQAAPTAEFAAPPVAGQPLQIRITFASGETQIVTLDSPPLAPVNLPIVAPPSATPLKASTRRHFDDLQTTPP